MVIFRDELGRFVPAPLQQLPPGEQQQNQGGPNPPLQDPPQQLQHQLPAPQQPQGHEQQLPQEEQQNVQHQQQQQQQGLIQPAQQAPAILPPPPGVADDLGQLRDALQDLFALAQQQQAAINLLQHGAHHPPPGSRSTIKLPPFNSNNPRLWFSQIESQFRLYNVVDEKSRFEYVAGQLDAQGANAVEDVIRSPPALAPYTTLKAELIRRIEVPEHQRMHQLLTGEDLGDRTPSQFLRHLRCLSTAVPDHLLRILWSQRLPSHVQAILRPHATSPTMTTDHLASIADDILAVSPAAPANFMPVKPSPVVAAVESTPSSTSSSPMVAAAASTASTSTRLDELSRQFTEMQSTLRALSRRPTYRSATPPSRRASSTHSTKSDDSGICWYHRKFGHKAKRCSAPCVFPLNSTDSRQ